MTLPSNKDRPTDLKNSSLHHDLKNQPGEDGNPDHTTDNDTGDKDALSEKVASAIKSSDDDTAIAQKLKNAVRKGT